jgi:hypothetical protein
LNFNLFTISSKLQNGFLSNPLDNGPVDFEFRKMTGADSMPAVGDIWEKVSVLRDIDRAS